MKQKKAKLNRKDFLFQNEWFNQMVKLPGQLHNQQFQISDCQECDILLFDAAACVYIDCCKFCRVFVGACQSSIFVRNCQHVQLVAITQQFRVRDSHQCTFRLFCESQPVIQSSYALYFNCYPNWGYPQLYKQIKECKIECWNNNWYDVYDFTPNKFGLFSNYTLESSACEGLKLLISQYMYKAGLKFEEGKIPKMLGGHLSQGKITAILIVSRYTQPFRSEGIACIKSKVSYIPAQLLQDSRIRVGNVMCKQKYLFIKICKQQLEQWRSILGLNILVEVQQNDLIQLIDNCILIGFIDEH